MKSRIISIPKTWEKKDYIVIKLESNPIALFPVQPGTSPTILDEIYQFAEKSNKPYQRSTLRLWP